MIKNYFKTAWRNLAKHRSNTLINVLGLALGICSALVIFLIVSHELSYDTFHPDRDRIYRIVNDQQDNATGNTDHVGGMINALPCQQFNKKLEERVGCQGPVIGSQRKRSNAQSDFRNQASNLKKSSIALTALSYRSCPMPVMTT